MASKDVYVLIPGTCEHVMLHGKRDLAAVTEVRVLRWGDYPDCPGACHVITRVLIRSSCTGVSQAGLKFGDAPWLVWTVEDGARSQGMRAAPRG